MTDRRQARSRTARLLAVSPDHVPAALAIGRCIEVWAEEKASNPHFSAMRRHDAARRAWLEAAGITTTAEACRIVPNGAPWSIEYRTARGETEYVISRLAAAGVRTTDIPRLRRQAQELLERTNRT